MGEQERRPRLLILDPYVRLQAADENNATEVAAILATLRELSRSFSLALLLVHHARKSPGSSAGQALRGSSDFHAWGDSNLYLRRRSDDLLLTIEHRAAAAPPPLTLTSGPLRLEIRDADPFQPPTCASLETSRPRRARGRPASPRSTPRRRRRAQTVRRPHAQEPRGLRSRRP